MKSPYMQQTGFPPKGTFVYDHNDNNANYMYIAIGLAQLSLLAVLIMNQYIKYSKTI